MKSCPRFGIGAAGRAGLALAATFLFSGLAVSSQAESVGIFEDHGDLGLVGKPGATAFDPAGRSYAVKGGGENMWFTNDAFQFVWRRVSGDFGVQAAIEWAGKEGNAHRKACLMVRQGLAPDAAYVDVAAHGNGLISLQYRAEAGGLTREIQARPPAVAPAQPPSPARVGLERQGEIFFVTLDQTGTGPGQVAGAFTRLKLTDPVYVGLGVCAHDNSRLEEARFTDVVLHARATPATGKPVLHCALETIDIGSKDRRARYQTTNHIEAPNWSRDGRWFLFNTEGRLYRLPVEDGKPEPIDTGFAQRCNNDHGLSPNGAWMAISDQSRGGKSLIYVVPAGGGAPRQLTELGPSYWHGWSPDGATVTYCAERDGEFDVYTIPVAGGPEHRLTTAKGLDDGPDYSPDGKFIYFNSERTGTMQVWRMNADGTGQEQLTRDEANNWFPHPSPDGKWLVFLSYDKGVTGHPANQPVRLRLMPAGGGPIQELAPLFGGQGTINVPSWSPDSRQVAFVSYELIVP